MSRSQPGAQSQQLPRDATDARHAGFGPAEQVAATADTEAAQAAFLKKLHPWGTMPSSWVMALLRRFVDLVNIGIRIETFLYGWRRVGVSELILAPTRSLDSDGTVSSSTRSCMAPLGSTAYRCRRRNYTGRPSRPGQRRRHICSRQPRLDPSTRCRWPGGPLAAVPR